MWARKGKQPVVPSAGINQRLPVFGSLNALTVTMGQRKRPVASQRNEFTKFVVQDELFNSFPGGLAVDKLMLVGCDLHDKTMLLKVAVGRAAALQRSFSNDPAGRRAMVAELQKRAHAEGATRIIFAYEASGLGFNLCDELEAQNIHCHVLAPSKIERSPKHRSSKTDEKDALRVLSTLSE